MQWVGLFGGPVLAAVAFLATPDAFLADAERSITLGVPGRLTAAITVLMGVWWMTEAIPIYATALIPLVVFPLGGVATITQTAAPYAHPLIFLFMGGFILALAMERWGLHKRIAITVLRRAGTGPTHIVAAFMIVTAVLSMWVSNTATAIMMLPIALSVIEFHALRSADDDVAQNHDNFALCMLLGIAYAATIGGVGTIVGTPPNLFLASFLRDELDNEVSFARWMFVGIPIVVVFLPIAWFVLVKFVFPLRDRPTTRNELRQSLGKLEPINRGERVTFFVFIGTALCWVSRPWLNTVTIGGMQPFANLSDTGIAMAAALTLFLIPVNTRDRVFVMDWRTASGLPWGLLILFGGGLSLAAAISDTGLSEYLGSQVSSLSGLPGPLIVLGVVALVIFLTEITSNTATAATLIPLLAGAAPGIGLSPTVLASAAAIAASCAFMLPVATPPNAVVFGSEMITIPEMTRAGFVLNIIGILLITLAAYSLVMPLLG